MNYSRFLFAMAASAALAVATQACAFSTDDASMNNNGKAAQFSDPDEKMPMGLSANYNENGSGAPQDNNDSALTNSPASAFNSGANNPYLSGYRQNR